MRHKWLPPALVAAACFGPVALAALLYYGPFRLDWLPRLPGHRELLAEPVRLPPEWAERPAGAYRWLLIYARMTPCEQQCTEPLRRLRQVQLALGGDQDRVGRALWYVAPAPELDDPDLEERRLDDAAASTLVAALGAERIGEGRVYVADPRGSVILSYPAEIEQKELLRDLKRLLAAAGTGR